MDSPPAPLHHRPASCPRPDRTRDRTRDITAHINILCVSISPDLFFKSCSLDFFFIFLISEAAEQLHVAVLIERRQKDFQNKRSEVSYFPPQGRFCWLDRRGGGGVCVRVCMGGVHVFRWQESELP